jgi:hypothetical protein
MSFASSTAASVCALLAAVLAISAQFAISRYVVFVAAWQLQLGVGPAPIPLPDLTMERLLAALQQLVAGQEQYSAAAAAVAGQLQEEDGLAAAVASVARTLRATHSTVE